MKKSILGINQYFLSRSLKGLKIRYDHQAFPAGIRMIAQQRYFFLFWFATMNNSMIPRFNMSSLNILAHSDLLRW